MLFLLFALTNNLYIDTDNYNIAVIANGLFGNNSSSLHLSALAWKFFSFLNNVFKTSDVFTLFNRTVIFMSFLSYSYFSLLKKQLNIKLFDFGLLFYISQVLKIWSANWTVQTAFYVFIGLVFIYKGENKIINIIGDIYVFIGVFYRFESALLFVPFILLIELYGYLNTKKINKKRIIILLMIYILLPLTNVVSEMIYDNKNEEIYDQTRVNILDYEIKEYKDTDLYSQGISEETYYFVRSWHFFDTDNINIDLLEKIEKSVSIKYDKLSDVHYVINTMASFLIGNYNVTILILVIIMMLISIIIKGNKLITFFSLLGFAGFLMIMYYFTGLARAEIRIWNSILFVLLMLYTCIKKESNANNCIAMICTVTLIVVSILNIGNINIDNVQLAINARKDNTSKIELVEKEDGNRYYIWDTNLFTEQFENGKLPTKYYVEHNVSSGDFYYGHNVYSTFLENINLKNPIINLISDEDVYYVSHSVDDIVNPYMKEHYGVELSATGEKLGDYQLWNVIK